MKKILQILVFFTLNGYAQQVSVKGHEFIKEHEGLILTVDARNQIGYGHLNKKGESYKRITKAKAEQLFVQDITEVNNAISRLLKELPKVKYTQGFIDGLGSLIYNCGEYGVASSEFYRRLSNCRVSNGTFNIQDFEFTLAAVKSLRCPTKGHKLRRNREYKLMRNGIYN
jgi:GH24 family phage-related lysozyme (muramidase)